MNATIYGKSNCSFCVKAKKLLEEKGIQYEEFFIGRDLSKEQLVSIVGKPINTVPQIYVEGNYVGGYTDLVAYLS